MMQGVSGDIYGRMISYDFKVDLSEKLCMQRSHSIFKWLRGIRRGRSSIFDEEHTTSLLLRKHNTTIASTK